MRKTMDKFKEWGSFLLVMLIIFHSVMAYTGIETYNKIGNQEYIAYYSELLKKEAPNTSFELRECVIKRWALTTKESIGGLFDAGFYGAMLPLTIITGGTVLPPKRSRPLFEDYPLVVTKQETSYFVEKCNNQI